jgi:hypothetical protein
MGYETSSFGNANGGNVTEEVHASYGQVETESGGVFSGGFLSGDMSSEKEATIYITGDDFAGATTFNTALTLPAGSIFREAIFDVTEAFTLGNADNIFSIGTDTSEATNGVAIANPDATGVTIDVTGGGTWVATAALAADTVVGVAVSGTTAGVTAGAGKAKVTIKYSRV